jgi:hypothetical protein
VAGMAGKLSVTGRHAPDGNILEHVMPQAPTPVYGAGVGSSSSRNHCLDFHS